MAKIKNTGLNYIMVLITGMISGFLIGVFLIISLVSYRIDSYMQRIVQFEAEIQEKDIKFKKLEDSVKSKKYVLKDIEVVLEFEGHELDKIAIEKFIKEKYNPLLGKEVKNIDADMSAEIIDKIIVRIKDRQYRLKTQKLVISETLKVWARADEIK